MIIYDYIGLYMIIYDYICIKRSFEGSNLEKQSSNDQNTKSLDLNLR